MFHAYPGEFIGECSLCWIALRIGTLLSLIALVLGLLSLITIGVTALRMTLCVWGAATFIAFIFIGNVIYWSEPLAALLSRCDFMREFPMFATLAPAGGRSALFRYA